MRLLSQKHKPKRSKLRHESLNVKARKYSFTVGMERFESVIRMAMTHTLQ